MRNYDLMKSGGQTFLVPLIVVPLLQTTRQHPYLQVLFLAGLIGTLLWPSLIDHQYLFPSHSIKKIKNKQSMFHSILKSIRPNTPTCWPSSWPWWWSPWSPWSPGTTTSWLTMAAFVVKKNHWWQKSATLIARLLGLCLSETNSGSSFPKPRGREPFSARQKIFHCLGTEGSNREWEAEARR